MAGGTAPEAPGGGTQGLQAWWPASSPRAFLPGPWQAHRLSYAKCPEQGQSHAARGDSVGTGPEAPGETWCCSAETQLLSRSSHKEAFPGGRMPPLGEKPWNVRNVLEPPVWGPRMRMGRWGHFLSPLRACRATGDLIPDVAFWHWAQASAPWTPPRVLGLVVMEPLPGSHGLLWPPPRQHQHPGAGH